MTDSRRPQDLSKSMLADLPMETSFVPGRDQTGESDDFVSGMVLAGRYELQERLGSGGMGSVWGAHDATTGDEVAIKVMKPGLVEQPEARKRFIKEALLARKMTHEGIVKVYDVQEADGELLIIMERLQGESLGQRLKKINDDQQLMGVEAALEFARNIGEVLSYLHRQNVIHCDIKPDNVWLNKDGSLKLLDFGISRALGHTLFQTMLHRAGGTAYYMAPEQFDSKRVVDPRADQYSLAVMLYEMLTGRIPMGRFKPVAQIRSEVGEALSEVIMTALNEAPEERYPDMSVFCAQLESRSMGATHQKPSSILPPDGESNAIGGKTSKKTPLYAGLLVAFLLGGGAYLWSDKGNKPETVPAPVPIVITPKPERVQSQAKVESVPVRIEPAKQSDPPKAPEVAKVVPSKPEIKKDAVVSAPQIAMVAIPGGSSQIGSSKDSDNPVRSVTIKSFELGKYEVTQGEWQAVMGSNPSYFKQCGKNCPVEQVSWDDIQVFLKKLNALSGSHYRLPTEVEWEYACYGGSKTEYCGGDNLEAVAWYSENSGSKTHAVGKKQANGYGLYDMSGNVWEWMENCYDSSCGSRVLRGGSWCYVPAVLRAANRYYDAPDGRNGYSGFRVAR